MKLIHTNLEGLVLIKPDVRSDDRGFFVESYSQRRLEQIGIFTVFVQDNHSFSSKKGTLRGLHFQTPPHAQTKLLRVTKGSIYDVVVDLRKLSPTFGKWRAFTVSAENFNQIYVPAGFAHGFCTLEKNTEIEYKVDCPYSQEHDAGVRWDDPDLKIDWPIKDPILSVKDQALPDLKRVISPFN